MRPIIGVTSSAGDSTKTCVNQAYLNAVIAAGGLPFVMPNKSVLASKYLAAVDGILFSGGGDIGGKYFNQETHEKATNISEERDAFEIALVRLAKEARKPITGICRGMQAINVALGGDILQHIESHSQKDARNTATHNVRIDKDTRLHRWLNKDIVRVNSFHHQVVRRVAPGFIITARSEDGYNEACEYEGGDWFCAAFQWHPEALLESPEHNAMIELFKPFVEACKR